jgi:phosphate transport system substrate-binding protein
VDYDTDEIGTINGEFLAEDTAKVVKGMILDLSDEPLVEALTDSTGWLVNELSIHVDTGGGFRLFCAGIGTQHPDISNA